MALPLLEAHGLTAITPDGVSLFSDLTFVLDRQLTALVGRNGSGKTTLARILAAHQAPDAGVVLTHGRVGWLPQEVRPDADARVMDLLGISAELSALQRIQAGHCEQADFDTIGDRWDLPSVLQGWLSRFGIAHLASDAPASRCSGGELTRLGLIRLLLQEPEVLILDEPTNHLDAAGREQLIEFLNDWPGGALVISHDRRLLGHAERILELSSLGLMSYPGPWSTYHDLKTQERAAAHYRHEVARAEHREQKRRRQAVLERQQHRLSQGRKDRREANQAKVLLDFSEQGSEATSARLRRQQADRIAASGEREHQARQALEAITPIALAIPPSNAVRGKKVLSLKGLSMGFGERMLYENLDLELRVGQRVAVHGANGCGKSVLLKLVCGALQPLSGQVEVSESVQLLDQHQSLLDDQQTAVENYGRLAPGLSEAEYRTRLARLGMAGEHVARLVKALSGGERLKLALAAILLGPKPPQLLLLDEPTNHQDLESVAALESAIREFDGALLVVSHDEHFLNNIGFTHELRLGTGLSPAVSVSRIDSAPSVGDA